MKYTPTVDPTLLNEVLGTLGVIRLTKTASQSVRLLYNHTLYVTLNSSINLAGTNFDVTPGYGTLRVNLTIPAWSANLSTSMSHAACRNCSAEYNSCFNSCKPDCVNDCEDLWWAPPCFGNTACCGLQCDATCATSCGAARALCEADVVACNAERDAINLLLSGHFLGMSFSSASVTQTADICVSRDCEASYPLENTIAHLNGFTLHLFPTGDPLGVGSWLNGIISGIVDWAFNIEDTIANFFETPEGDGVLISAFAWDIATDGLMPVQPVLDCMGTGCAGSAAGSTLGVRPGSAAGFCKRLAYVLIPFGAVIGLLIWRRKRQEPR